MLKIPSPLVIFETRHGSLIAEKARWRPDTTSDMIITEGIALFAKASVGNPDEIIIRILRPVRE